MSEWYVAGDGKQEGPFGPAEMTSRRQRGQLPPDVLVWREGMSDWQPAGTVPAFSEPEPVAAMTGPALLSYATPTTLAAAPEETIAPIPVDEGPFVKLGGNFNSGAGSWTGTVVASPRAIYMLKKAKNTRNAGLMAGGGLVGALVAMAVQGHETDDTRTCTLADLPPTLRQKLSKKPKHLGLDVIVVARETINRVSVPLINNLIRIRVGSVKMSVSIGLFRNGSIRRWLTQNGWTINADLMPTAAPVFGQSFGRPEPLQVKKTHPALRALYILLAIAIFIAVVWLRVTLEKR